jgi:hypothetical protein
MENEETENKAWVVGWEYSDHSGHELVRVFEAEEPARVLHTILQQHGSDGRKYYCKAVPFESY